MKPNADGLIAQAVYSLDAGDLVAVAITITPAQSARLAVVGRAWLVDTDGDLQAVGGQPVQTACSHSATAQEVIANGVQGLAEALRDLLLGEPDADPPVIAWDAELRAQVSIKNVIAIARAAGTPIDWSLT
ncbi:hypothetical protein [Casimicrobium huifangae]|uniref:hypothetical protein n=1 Tax=Casimicrobium huifangae TaxID=2591109 RepID=UPI003784FABB